MRPACETCGCACPRPGAGRRLPRNSSADDVSQEIGEIAWRPGRRGSWFLPCGGDANRCVGSSRTRGASPRAYARRSGWRRSRREPVKLAGRPWARDLAGRSDGRLGYLSTGRFGLRCPARASSGAIDSRARIGARSSSWSPDGAPARLHQRSWRSRFHRRV